MKRIEAILRPEKLEAVRKGLREAKCEGLMISEIEGHGRQKGIIQQWRGEKYKVELLPKVKVETVVPDKDVERIIAVIIEAAQTGEIGDGKIFVSPVEEAIRIRTGERGRDVL